MQEIVDEIARVLDASVTLEDRSFRLLAYGAQSGDIDAVRQESILRRKATDEVRAHFEAYGIATATGPVRIPAIPGLLGRICVPLRHGGVTYGYLWLLDSPVPHPELEPHAEPEPHARPASHELTDDRLAMVAPLVDRAAAVLAREARTRRAPLWDFFSEDPGTRAAAELDVAGLEGPVVAIAVRTPPETAAALWTLPRGVLADPGPGRQGEPLTALLAPAGLARESALKVHAMYGTAVGLGEAREDPAEAWRGWREAVLAVRVAEHVDRHAPIADWPQLGVYRMLVRLPRGELAELAARSAALGDLAETVEAYLDRGGHAQETAALLGIHRQTLYYRLGRAEQLTGLRLSDGENRLELHLSLKAAGLMRMPARRRAAAPW